MKFTPIGIDKECPEIRMHYKRNEDGTFCVDVLNYIVSDESGVEYNAILRFPRTVLDEDICKDEGFITHRVLEGQKMFGINNIIANAVRIVFKKFPNEAKDYRKNCACLFDLSEMVANELIIKHGNLFVEDSMKDFVDVKELDFGE